MQRYNKIMTYVWLFASITIFIIVTFLGFKHGFRDWAYYYIIAALTFLMYLLRKYMMKRMERHLEYLKNKDREEQK